MKMRVIQLAVQFPFETSLDPMDAAIHKFLRLRGSFFAFNVKVSFAASLVAIFADDLSIANHKSFQKPPVLGGYVTRSIGLFRKRGCQRLRVLKESADALI